MYPNADFLQIYQENICLVLNIFQHFDFDGHCPQRWLHNRRARAHKTRSLYAIQGQRPVHHGGCKKNYSPGIETDLLSSQGLASSFMFSLGGAGLMVMFAIILTAADFFHFLSKGAGSDAQSQYTQDKPHDAPGSKPKNAKIVALNICIMSSFPARWVRVHGSELCLLFHLHEDEIAGLHAIVNLKS